MLLRSCSLLFLILACGACDKGDARPTSPDQALPVDGSTPVGERTIIDHVTVVDARGVQRDRAVILVGEQILRVEDAGQSWPAGSAVIDGRGKYLVPGLVDPHLHLTLSGATIWVGDPLEANMRANLYHGITAVMDVGGPTMLFELRELIESGEVVGPTLRATGPFLTAVGSHPCETFPFGICRFIEPSNAEKEARLLVDGGADALKVALADAAFTPWPTPRLELSALAPVTQLGVPVIAHVDSSQDVVDAVAQGVDVLGHPPFDAPISPAALQASLEARAMHTTLGAFSAVVELVDGDLDLEDPLLLVGQGVLDNWRTIRAQPELLLEGYLAQSRGWTEHSRANVKALHRMGAPLVPGSDAGYLFIPHGHGLHRELVRLAELGWDPLELLAAATLDARRQIGLTGGLVEEGAVADLLLVSADPTQDVRALQQIERVILRGRVYQREALRTLDLYPGLGADGAVCLEPDDCASGLTCDGLEHRCRSRCDAPYSAVDSCGPGAWCMPEDGFFFTARGVCHQEPSCALYGDDCGLGFYSMTCTPQDENTNACRQAASQPAGGYCSYTDLGSTCGVGLYCSPLDEKCYALCDPAGGESCTTPSTCMAQAASDHGADWFGLCLP